ncbi:6682_t:CDS:2, partial [Entrophospora sp. SA101]
LNTPIEQLKISDAITLCAKAWKNVTPETIRNCWLKTGIIPNLDDTMEIETNFVENNYIDQNSGDGNLIHQINFTNQDSCIVDNSFVDQDFTGVVGGDGSDITGQNPSITTSINYLNNCFDNSFIGDWLIEELIVGSQ